MAKKPKTKKPGRSGKIVRKLLLWFIGIIGALILLLIIIAALFEGKIGNLVINSLNKSLKTKLEVERAELSLVWSFPNASVNLKNAKIKGLQLGGDTDKDLATINSLSLECGIWGLITGNYNFTSAKISDGDIYVYRDKKGLGNYDIWISEEDSTVAAAEDGLNISIEKATFRNVGVQYIDKKLAHDFKIDLVSSYFSGNFADNKFSMYSYAELKSHYLEFEGDRYLEGKEVAYDATIEIDQENGLYSFTEVEVTMEANKFAVDGAIESQEKGTDFDITFGSDRASLNSLLQLMPQSYIAYLGGFKSNANLYFNAKVNGLYSDKSIPFVDVTFGLKDGRVSHDDMSSSLKGVNFDIHFTTGDPKDDKSAIFEVQNFTGELDGYPLDLKLSSKGLDNPLIDFSFNGALSLGGTYGWFGKQVTSGSGSVEIEKLYLKGHYNDMITPNRISRVKLGGIINFKQAALTVNDIDAQIETGTFSLQNNDLTIQNFMFRAADSDVVLNGQFNNTLPVIFADSINSKSAELSFHASLNSGNLDIDKIIEIFKDPKADNPSQLPVAQQEQVVDSLATASLKKWEYLTNFLKGTFVANIKNLKYDKITAQNFSGLLDFQNNVLRIQNLKVDAMDGLFELNTKVIFDKTPSLEAYLDCTDVDVERFFYEMDNFGQETILDRHLKGRLNSLIKINAFWGEQGNFQDSLLFVAADVKLTDGELVGFEMLEEFSKFIKLKDLRRIRFSELKNQFIIQNRVFKMPAMFIRSSALNLVVAGTHNFNQDIDYKLKIHGGQVLAQKFKKYNPELKPLKAKKKGTLNFYGRIFGNLDSDDYEFKLGKKNVKTDLEVQLSQELPLLSNTLRMEFQKSSKMAGATARSAISIANKLSTLSEPEEWKDIPGAEESDIDDSGDEWNDPKKEDGGNDGDW